MIYDTRPTKRGGAGKHFGRSCNRRFEAAVLPALSQEEEELKTAAAITDFRHRAIEAISKASPPPAGGRHCERAIDILYELPSFRSENEEQPNNWRHGKP